MKRRPKEPNERLAELVTEAGLSEKRKGFARRVVERGRAVGLELSYDHNSVRRWLSGEQPNPPAPQLIAAVLSECIGRRITPVDCGFSRDGDTADMGLEFGLSWSDGVDSSAALWRSDVERRGFLKTAAYAIAVYPAASMRWLTMPGTDRPVSNGRRRIGQSDVESVRAMTAAFRDADNRSGGGQVRPAVVAYLHNQIRPMLRGNYLETVGRALFAATSELTKLAGWMAYDQEEHGRAQRYLIQALRFARTAGDPALGAEILAAMSHHATYVGRPGDAVDLARAAQIGARKAGLAVLESECHMVEAHGHAARNDPDSCALSLSAAERAFDREQGDPPEWLAYFDEAYLSAKVAHCFRDLGDPGRTATYAEQSLDMADGYLRGKTFNLCLLAGARAADDPLEAVRVGNDAIELAEGLSSRRSHAYLRGLRHRLDPFRDMPEVGELREKITLLTARV